MAEGKGGVPHDVEKRSNEATTKTAVGLRGDVHDDDDAYDAGHVEASAVDGVYGRKVYIMNKIMNEQIGMTWWQWGLLCVAGVGWLIDNAWLQLVAVILPQVEREFEEVHGAGAVTQPRGPFMTLSLFAGLIVGAAFWGIAADVVGRRFSFNATLLIAGVFGTAAGGATSFATLGGLFAALGFGLGGSLPVDGMLFLEFLPGNRQNLLTLLSVFWSLGQLLTSLVGWAFIVNYSCDSTQECSEKNGMGWMVNNKGWRYLNFTIGAFTLACFFLRFVVFKIPESPKFLISKGRDAEAVVAMKRFAAMCGKPLPDDALTVGILRSAAGEDGTMDEVDAEKPAPRGTLRERTEQRLRGLRKNMRGVSFVPSLSHIKPLYSTRALGYTTTIIWLLWAIIGIAYPLFNSFIILYLGNNGSTSPSLVYRNYVIISVCGVPGSLIAAWLVDLPRSGRRGAMALGTLLTGVFLFGFTGVHTSDGQLAFSCVTAFTQNIMYGVLYCYTPEAFPAPLRGTADGIGSSLNRVLGLVATIVKLYGADTNPATPIYISAALFIVAAALMLTLRVETAARTAL
ncbi:hypothetical protein MSPP1_001383 [Malassezia sp. CBS 17886]|nr:hypothetical protein MSPP1_001383 [Malassezia sp. CBS 17886]